MPGIGETEMELPWSLSHFVKNMFFVGTKKFCCAFYLLWGMGRDNICNKYFTYCLVVNLS